MSKDRIGPCIRANLVSDVKAVDGGDSRVRELRTSVGRLRRALALYPVQLPDRQVAEDELAVLEAQAASGTLSVPRLRRSLLVVTGALGSVSAMAGPLAQVRRAIDHFGPA